MTTWQDEPDAREWRQAVDTADRARGPSVPPGYHRVCAAIDEAVGLLADSTMPGALTATLRGASHRRAASR
ncbi:hypothetical protein [Streptomyces sp. NPDC006739]|uniref:hypothetical protein n=1 Tax=Streptomyces sp. NPDC006739 TaxID=3364763 RepID=UPI0036BD4BA0